VDSVLAGATTGGHVRGTGIAWIFVNYRREDEPFGAALIDEKLSVRFGSAAVFRASWSIPVGADFERCLLTALRGCSVLLVVIGRRWLRGADGGTSRIHNRADWVRREIAEAFAHGVRVVPVLLEADLPSEGDLPADIAALARCQHHQVRYRSADRDVDHLIDKLVEFLPNSEGYTNRLW
jgi:hypothetical protein